MAHDDWDFEEARRALREESEDKRRRFPLWFALASALALLILAIAGRLVYDQLTGPEDEAAAPPLVRAEEGPVKVRPEEPGGIEVPDRDKLVYDRLTGESTPVEPERLLPPPQELSSPPEEVPEPEAPADVGQEAAAEPEASPAGGPESEVARTAPPPAEPAPQGTFAPDRETEMALAPAAPEQVRQPLLPGSPSAATEGGRYLVQFGAFRTPEQAERAWEQLRKAHPDLLGRLELTVQRADLGPEKGVFFRTRSGPFATAAAAKVLCEKMKSRNVGCFVVKG